MVGGFRLVLAGACFLNAFALEQDKALRKRNLSGARDSQLSDAVTASVRPGPFFSKPNGFVKIFV